MRLKTEGRCLLCLDFLVGPESFLNQIDPKNRGFRQGFQVFDCQTAFFIAVDPLGLAVLGGISGHLYL